MKSEDYKLGYREGYRDKELSYSHDGLSQSDDYWEGYEKGYEKAENIDENDFDGGYEAGYFVGDNDRTLNDPRARVLLPLKSDPPYYKGWVQGYNDGARGTDLTPDEEGYIGWEIRGEGECDRCTPKIYKTRDEARRALELDIKFCPVKHWIERVKEWT